MPSWRETGLFGATVAVALGYLVLNKPIGHVHVLETSLDRRIPREPVFAVPYLAFVVLFWLVVLAAFVRRRRWPALAAAIIATYLASYLVYALYQTSVPRSPVHGSSVFDALLRFVYRSDRPYNDFPSIHASSAAIFALYLYFTRNRWWIAGATFAALVVASTLFVKQHVIADAVSGVALGATATVLAFRFVK